MDYFLAIIRWNGKKRKDFEKYLRIANDWLNNRDFIKCFYGYSGKSILALVTEIRLC